MNEIMGQVLQAFKEAQPKDLSISEVARKIGVKRDTAAKYIKILEAKGKLRISRVVGSSKFFELTSASKKDLTTHDPLEEVKATSNPQLTVKEFENLLEEMKKK